MNELRIVPDIDVKVYATHRAKALNLVSSQ